MKNKFMQSSIVLAIIAIGITIGSVFITQYIVGTIAFIFYGTSKYSETPTIFFVLAYSLATLMLLLGYALFGVWIERREVTEFAKKGAAKELGQGIAIGSGIIAVVVAILWMLGYYKVVGTATAEVLVRPLFSSILAGVAGEVIFRGILFRFVEKGWGSRIALILFAILFGFLHAANPNATFVGGLAIAVGAGLLLGSAYMWTRRLWLVMGIHFAWNFTLG
ncbi:MAG: CPBP family intramembrane metalloprotease [Chloroflexota bacterium]